MLVEIPEKLYKAIEVVAKKRELTVEVLIADMIVKDLDPIARIDIYLELSEKHLREVEELYGKGDIVQAGEKYWGQAIEMQRACMQTTTRIS